MEEIVNERTRLLEYPRKVGRRICLSFMPTVFAPSFLRAMLIGTIASLTMADVYVYMHLQNMINSGYLPWFDADICVVFVMGLEMVLAPTVAWLGHARRRTLMVAWHLAPAVAFLLLLPIKQLELVAGNELCRGSPSTIIPDVGWLAGIRLATLVFIAVCLALSRQALWCHGLAYFDEHDPEAVNLNIGILVVARVVFLVVLPKQLERDMQAWMQALSIVVPMLLSAARMARMPEKAPLVNLDFRPVSDIDRGYMISILRTIRNTYVMALITAMSLLIAAHWGYLWYDVEMRKAIYLESPLDTGFVPGLSYLFPQVAVVFAVLLVGVRETRPFRRVFDRIASLKYVVKLSLPIIAMYLITTLWLDCERGPVAGLVNGSYVQPTCSQHCGCLAPWSGYRPLCLNAPTPTTFLAPCHAGCGVTQLVGTTTMYNACKCGEYTATVAGGACALPGCAARLDTHRWLVTLSTGLTVIAVQMLLEMLLRGCDGRDRSVALGVAGSVIAATCSTTHVAYSFYSVFNCLWSERGICMLQNRKFASLVGSTSAALVSLSTFITLVMYFIIRRRGK